MSGIAGILYFDSRPVNPADLRRMLDRMAHRGPDGSQLRHDGPAGFGHVMLHTTHESLHERYPMQSAGGNLFLTADARIDNRDELISILRPAPSKGAPVTDGQLILHAYEKWGQECAKYLLGDFAFAIWDRRARMLYCARDPMGVKPFFYCRLQGAFVFASEIKALLSLPDLPQKLNEERVADFLGLTYRDQDLTFYEGILRLSPAHSLTVTPTGAHKRRYWQLDPEREERLSSDGEYIEAFRSLFTEAVRCRLRSAFPVGATLSGGLDSSAIACLSEKLIGEGRAATPHGAALNTFSGIFPETAQKEPTSNERPYVDAVLNCGNFNAHFVRGDECRLFDEVLCDDDECSSLLNIYLYSLLSRAAAERSVRIVLSGFEGDVTVSYGYEHLSHLAHTGRWADFAAEVGALVAHPAWSGWSQSTYLSMFGFPELKEAARRFRWLAYGNGVRQVASRFPISAKEVAIETGLKVALPAWAVRWQRRLRGMPETERWFQNNPSLNAAFARKMHVDSRYTAENLNGYSGPAKYRYGHISDLTGTFLQCISDDQNQIAARNGIEQRYPFFDRRLMEFCVAIPFDQKLRRGQTRYILRQAMKDCIPPAVADRGSKGTMGLNTRRLLAEERPRLDRLLQGAIDLQTPSRYIDIDRLRSAYDRVTADAVGPGRTDVLASFLGTSFLLWLAHHEELT